MKYSKPFLEICPKCKRHAFIVLHNGSKSMGFMTKQTGFSILASYHERMWITEDEYRKVYEEVSNSPLSQSDTPEGAWHEVIQMRLIWIYQKAQEGARLVEPYYACEKDNPKLVRGTLSEIAKANLN